MTKHDGHGNDNKSWELLHLLFLLFSAFLVIFSGLSSFYRYRVFMRTPTAGYQVVDSIAEPESY